MENARTLRDLIRAKACLQCVCRRCRHGALLFPMALGEDNGWHLTVDEIAPRLRCSKCFSAHVNVYEAQR
jgi:hypothetical protein